MATTQVKPMTDHIVLQAVEEEEVTTSGLVIPESAKERPQHGHVIAVGPGKVADSGASITMDELSEGDRVLYQMYAGTKVEIEKTDYIVVRFQDVLAKLETGAAKKAKKR